MAQHKKDFDELGVKLLGVSVDDRQNALEVWQKVVDRQFTILSDPGARTIRKYGVLHAGGGAGQDIALDTSLLVDKDGRELWRYVSQSLPDLPDAKELLDRIRKTIEKETR